MKRILVTEDETAIREFEVINLRRSGYEVVETDSGEKALEMFDYYNGDFDLAVIDIMLPGIDGLTVCKKLKSNPATADIPIIMLTAKNTPTDIVVGLELGANDYVTKPFNNQVLVARIRNQLRQSIVEPSSSNVVKYKTLVVNEEEFRAEINGVPLDLTKTEFDILLLLIKSPGRVYTRAQIISNLKNGEYADITDRSIDVQILNLRRKLGDFATNIETIRGVGYRMQQLIGDKV